MLSKSIFSSFDLTSFIFPVQTVGCLLYLGQGGTVKTIMKKVVNVKTATRLTMLCVTCPITKERRVPAINNHVDNLSVSFCDG